MNEQKTKKGITIFLVIIVILVILVALFTLWGKQNNKKEISMKDGQVYEKI